MRDIQALLGPQYAYSILQLKCISETQEVNIDTERCTLIKWILLVFIILTAGFLCSCVQPEVNHCSSLT